MQLLETKQYQLSWVNGVNTTLDITLMDDTLCAYAENVDFRGGKPKTRKPFVFEASIHAEGFRGAFLFASGTQRYLIAVTGSVIRAVDMLTGEWNEIGTFTTSQGMVFFTQINNFLVIHDGVTVPAVFEFTGEAFVEGVMPFMHPELGEGAYTIEPIVIPAGTIGIFAQQRYHYVPIVVPNTDVPGDTSLLSLNLLNTERPTSVFETTENEYLAGGGCHALPADIGSIRGIGWLRSAGTGDGRSSIAVIGERGASAFDFSVPREQWGANQISEVLFHGYGCAAPRSVINARDDLIFRGYDGLHSLKFTAGAARSSAGMFQSVILNANSRSLFTSDEESIENVSLAVADGYIYCNESPEQEDAQLVVFDGDAKSYSQIQDNVLPCYGIYTGTEFAQVLQFETARDSRLVTIDKEGNIYSLDPEDHRDPNDTPIRSVLETKAFGTVMDNLSQNTRGEKGIISALNCVTISVKDIVETTTFEIFYRHIGYPYWAQAGNAKTILVEEGSTPISIDRLIFPIQKQGAPCNPATMEPLYKGNLFQIRIEWTGRATIAALSVNLGMAKEEAPFSCKEDTIPRKLELGENSGIDKSNERYTFNANDTEASED